MSRRLACFLAALACTTPAAGAGVDQSTSGWCSPAINGNGNRMDCRGVDPRAMRRLEELLDQKDRDLNQKNRDLKEKIAEANEWAQKYTEANTELINVRRQLEAKGEDATLVQMAQNFLHEGNLTALQNLNLSRIPANDVNTLSSTIAAYVSSGASIANPQPTLGVTGSPIGSPFTATGTHLVDTNPTLDVTGGAGVNAFPTGNANPTLAALSGPINFSTLAGIIAAATGTHLADTNPTLDVAGTAAANAFATGNANPTLAALTLSGPINFGMLAGSTPAAMAAAAANASPTGNANPTLTALTLSAPPIGNANPDLIVTGTAAANAFPTGSTLNARYTPWGRMGQHCGSRAVPTRPVPPISRVVLFGKSSGA